MIVAEIGPPLPPFLPRTRLYHLAPIGVGTAAVESLTGYLLRLAEAHCVPPGTLVRDELLPVLRPEGLGDLPPASWLGRWGGRLDGPGDLARDAVAALAQLTGRRDLAALTLVPWSTVLATHGLPRRRAWCGACFAQAVEQGTALYEPLAWAIRTVTVCARHRIRLSDRCPHPDCGRSLPLLAAHARPGHCSWCERLLVLPKHGPAEPAPECEELQWGCWIAGQVGALLAAGATFAAMPHPLDIGAAIEAFTMALGKRHPGTHGAFARTVGIHANLIHQWRTAQILPTLPLLLRMSHALGVSLVQLITGDTAALLEGRAKHPSRVPAPPRTPRNPPMTPDPAPLRQMLEALDVANHWPPLSGAAVARHLACPDAALRRCFPDEWQRLVSRYRAYQAAQKEARAQELALDVQRAILQLNAQGLYPSARRIRPLLRRRIHPRNSDFYAIRRQLLQELGCSLEPTVPALCQDATRSS
jgi:hypothetical protein